MSATAVSRALKTLLFLPLAISRSYTPSARPSNQKSPNLSVVADVAIDQGGCVETIHATTHENPTYVVDGVIHYCVANMPGAVARTSTFALNNATLPFILALADKGPKRAMAENPHLLAGLNVHAGRITYPAVAKALGVEAVPAVEAIG